MSIRQITWQIICQVCGHDEVTHYIDGHDLFLKICAECAEVLGADEDIISAGYEVHEMIDADDILPEEEVLRGLEEILDY